MRNLPVLILMAASTAFGESPGWVAKSNQNAQVLIEAAARYDPESAGQAGVSGLDEEIRDLTPKSGERRAQAIATAAKTLRVRLDAEKDPLVRQDLEILIRSAEQEVHEFELNEKYYIPYLDAPQTIYSGIRALLDDQVAASRRPAALTRLRRYTGLDAAYTPLIVLAERRTREKLEKPGLRGPAIVKVNKNLANTKFFVDGIGELFEKYKIAGYQEAYAKLREQTAAYDNFIRKEVLPKSTADFRLPPELYDFSLAQFGVDIPATELTARAHAAFRQIQDEMQSVAAQVAKQKGLSAPDYRDVIGELKKDQLVGEEILPHYQKRIAQVEEIIRRERLVTLPNRPARMILASPAETAQQPAPNMRPPRLIGNTGESGVFVLPLNIPGPPGEKSQRSDDFTFTAASWTLTSHEVRPGHELQFDAMVEHGVSQARAIFAFNSTNVEGWGLYSEFIMKPFMPLDGQLISLQHRLMRAARAYLDPELHSGKITPEQAFRVLREDVVLSEAMANQEVERYTFRMPAQATSYFYGYTRLSELRADTERELGAKFNQQKFHDFILGQGLLPPALLRKAVFADFIGKPLAL
jgi:Bacterial protein of unknown function (DUF885)